MVSSMNSRRMNKFAYISSLLNWANEFVSLFHIISAKFLINIVERATDLKRMIFTYFTAIKSRSLNSSECKKRRMIECQVVCKVK